MSANTFAPSPLKPARVLLAVLVCLSLAGCIAIGTTPKPKTVLFAGNAPDWRPFARNRAWSGYRKPGFDPAAYQAVIVEPVIVDAATKRAVADTAQQEMAAALRGELATALSRFARTDTPAPGVLRVRATITAIGRPNKAINAAGLPTGLLGLPMPVMSTGGAAIEAEVVDAVSGERLAALSARAKGGKGPLGGLRDFDQTRNALHRLARALGALLADPRTLAAR